MADTIMINNNAMELNEEMLENVTGGAKKKNNQKYVLYYVEDGNSSIRFKTIEKAYEYSFKHQGSLVVPKLVSERMYMNATDPEF